MHLLKTMLPFWQWSSLLKTELAEYVPAPPKKSTLMRSLSTANTILTCKRFNSNDYELEGFSYDRKKDHPDC